MDDTTISRAEHISIHAPARGATRVWNSMCRSFVFQSTLPRGERRTAGRKGKRASEFQSTLPRGERQRCMAAPRSERYFNPRSREGSDSNFYSKSYLILGKNCLKLLKSLNISILQNIFKHSMTYFQVRIP